jgi:4-hydroxythreonine-4-phosphate dehydrogenase
VAAASSGSVRPTIAFAMGDPAGISPELAARLLAMDDIRSAAQLVVFGDRRILDGGREGLGRRGRRRDL